MSHEHPYLIPFYWLVNRYLRISNGFGYLSSPMYSVVQYYNSITRYNSHTILHGMQLEYNVLQYCNRYVYHSGCFPPCCTIPYWIAVCCHYDNELFITSYIFIPKDSNQATPSCTQESPSYSSSYLFSCTSAGWKGLKCHIWPMSADTNKLQYSTVLYWNFNSWSVVSMS